MEKWNYVICLLFIIQNVLSQTNYNLCFTPIFDDGVCINIKKCSMLKIMLETQRHNSTVVAFLRKSSCGFDGKDPKVCCPLKDVSTEIRSNLNTNLQKTKKTEHIGSSGYETITSRKLPSQNTCGRPSSTHVRVVGGQKAELGSWPWMTALGYQDKHYKTISNYQWLCGGALISDRYVLTAAHCVANLGNIKVTVARLGDLDLDPNVEDEANPIDVLISDVIIHERYNPQIFTNDIALLKLKTNVIFNDLIQPICLPTYSEIRAHKLVHLNPFVSGWGATSYRGPSSTHLMEVQLPVLDNNVCKKAFENRSSIIDDRILCAGNLKGGQDSCQGDSGGPLMFPSGNQYYLVGTVSYGFKCAEKGFPGVYTRTTSFLDWIVHTMNNS